MEPRVRCFYIESGDFFTFSYGENPENAVRWHILHVLRVNGATLGEEIIVKSDYRGKIVARFQSAESLREINVNIRYGVVAGRLYFTKVPVGRSSKFDAWQYLYKVGTPMFKDHRIGRWLQESARVNPVTQVSSDLDRWVDSKPPND